MLTAKVASDLLPEEIRGMEEEDMVRQEFWKQAWKTTLRASSPDREDQASGEEEGPGWQDSVPPPPAKLSYMLA